ncbi:hypothetical protein JAAARDRAFT_190349 [Jaapia argillacea MUCL 33604]|uniref:Uncharacterized protein n=1 Tax=Jaapia argillacea MUCL 33604 TaxID=933084 RepID=A0A067Q3Q5_9AGAM|nr:hypothetical protein JAAARDRAFT_190349 [Jaapia argillacea MUCL 33604]
MSTITTPITRLLDIQTPVIGAPMAGASGGLLAAEVTSGGGFGFIAVGYDTIEGFKNQLALARSTLRLDPAPAPLPIGIGFLAWKLEEPDSIGPQLLEIALENRPKAVWFAFGNDLGRWIRIVHEHNKKQEDGQKTLVFVQLSTVEQALIAVNEWKIDVLVAQGIESGGHGLGSAPPLFTLVPNFLAALPKDHPPIVGAGGLANGAHIAALLTLGAAGAVLGTRFLLTPESLYSDAQRDALIAARSTESVRTMAFDQARGTLGWPAGIDGRALYNKTVAEADQGISITEIRAKYLQAARDGDREYMLTWAGAGVGLMNEVNHAADVVRELHQETLESLRFAASLLQ